MALPSLATSHAKTRKRDRFYGVAYSTCAPWLPLNMNLSSVNSEAADIDMAHMLQRPCQSKPAVENLLGGSCALKKEKGKEKKPNTIDLNDLSAEQRAMLIYALLMEESRRATARPTKRPSSQINLDGIVVPDNYLGPSFDKNNLSEQLFTNVIEYVKKPGNLLHPKYIQSIALEFLKVVKPLKNVVHVNNDTDDSLTTVVGDLHGQYDDLMTIFKLNGYPSAKNKYIFNGDFVDRGEMSVEIILTLYLAKLIWPNSVFLNRGNHETREMNFAYGFVDEMRMKYDANMFELFSETFGSLPVAHIINDDVFVVHGGIPSGQQAVSIDAINKVDRDSEPGDDSILVDMLWADPQTENGYGHSARGSAKCFGPDKTEEFLKKNNLTRLVRSHEAVEDGCKFDHNNKTITVFSASNYCGRMENLGAILRFKGTGKSLEPEVIRYKAKP